MNYGVILAGGSGTRMKNIKIPKQFYEIEGVPIIIFTLRQLIKIEKFNCIYIAIANDYIDYMNDLLEKHISQKERENIIILEGGRERIDSLHNVIKHIENDRKINDDDIIVIHDAVRPFVTEKILNDSIEGAKEYGAVVAAVPVSDTILKSITGEVVDNIPVRKELYKGQAPDSFRLKTLIDLEKNLTLEQKEKITGTSQICTFNNYPIHMIEGDDINFKITTNADLEIAESLIASGKRREVCKKLKK